MGDLLDAVDELTLPKRVKVMQDEGVVSVTIPPLLTQLDEIIRSDIGLTASGASLAHERNILDADALYRFIQISSQIRDWCRLVGVRPGGTPALALRQWFVAATPDEQATAWHVRKLGSWAAYIRAKLDPPRERELPDRCPDCGATEWWRDGVRFLHPLVIKYRVGPGLVDQATAVCRACEKSWAVRELAFALESAA
jgi:hypothetical protein